MRRLNKKRVVCMAMIFFIIIASCLIIFREKDPKIEENNVQNENSIVEIVSDDAPDEETPEEIVYINMNNEEKIKCCSILGTFENGKKLSDEQYLKVAYNAINCGYVNSNKTVYSKSEIDNIVYSIFNVTLINDQSIDGLSYDNGKYTYEGNVKSNVSSYETIESGNAAGNTYVMYSMNNKRYIARLTANGVTGEVYISSIAEDK